MSDGEPPALRSSTRAFHRAIGPFASVFERGPTDAGHLELLRLEYAGATAVVDRIAAAVKAGDTQRWLTTLLSDANWRLHLVGAIALLLEPTLDASLLWSAIDQGSWVIPQLVVTAAHVDPQFRERVRERVAAHCPVVVPSGLTSAERCSATGPEGETTRSAKMIASMLAVAGQFADLADWRARVLDDERVKDQLAADDHWNKSDKIIEMWLSGLKYIFHKRGYRLELVG